MLCIVEPTQLNSFRFHFPELLVKGILGQDARARWLYLLLCTNKEVAVNCDWLARLHVLVYIVDYTCFVNSVLIFFSPTDELVGIFVLPHLLKLEAHSVAMCTNGSAAVVCADYFARACNLSPSTQLIIEDEESAIILACLVPFSSR
jgi:hypothetical protein